MQYLAHIKQMISAKKKNVIMVLADQHHASLMSCTGHPQAITPNLDRFAKMGMRFDAAYAQNPICTPSRVSILSGQYCQNHGYYGLSGPVKPGLNNLFRHFKKHGYRTAAYGKLHLPDSPQNWIADDVDEFGDAYEGRDGTRGDGAYLKYLESLGLRELEDSHHNIWNYGKPSISLDAQPSMLPYTHTLEMWCVQQCIDFIGTDPEKPYCIQLAFQKPHHPLLPQKKFWDLYPEDIELPEGFSVDPSKRPPHFQKAYELFREINWDYAQAGESFEDGARRAWRGTLACVTQIDDVFGQLLDYLEEKNLLENTIVVYGSDHGCYHGLQGIAEKAPGICSENVCRVPMIWYVPDSEASGKVSPLLVENVDITPTLTSLCRLPELESADGCDLSPLLYGDDNPLRTLAATENVWSKSIRWEHWRFVHYQRGMFQGDDIGELYDLEADPKETQNLYHSNNYKNIVEESRRRLLEWLIEKRRSTTTQTTIKEPNVPDYTKGARYSYPVCSDGTAPNRIQAKHRNDIHQMYL